MARYELFRTARTPAGLPDAPHRLVLAHETRELSSGYVVGKLYVDGGPLVAVTGTRSLRSAVKVMTREVELGATYEPEGRLAGHPTLGSGQWLTIHARDGATVVVSMLESPGQRLWVSTRYVLESSGSDPVFPDDASPERQREIMASMTQDDC